MICDRNEFFHALGDKRDRRQAWKQQYYYRCLTVALAEAFIRALLEQRNYVKAADVYHQFPSYNFHNVFQMICKLLGGSYKHGKCYTRFSVDDYRYFIQLRNNTRTADELMARWKQYIEQKAKLEASRAGSGGL